MTRLHERLGAGHRVGHRPKRHHTDAWVASLAKLTLRPTVAACTKYRDGWPGTTTRPVSIVEILPVTRSRAAPTGLVGKPSERAKSFEVPSGRTPSTVSASAR